MVGAGKVRLATMKFLSVCSGIEAASVAWEPLGWKAVGFSEIEPFQSAVLKHHFPNTPNYGDLTKYAEWPIEPGTVDILVGGTPCQSFSILGKRGGLDDIRGQLAMAFGGLAGKLRPRWIVWENVVGVLSSDHGRDFLAFQRSLVELGYCLSFRVLDSSGFGTSQKRRRVFVVGHLGTDWRYPASVLLERGSLLRDAGKGGSAREEDAEPVEDGSDEGCAAVSFQPGNLRRKAGASPSTKFFPTLLSNSGDQCPHVATDRFIRSLSCREWERLQGFPHDWTNVVFNGKEPAFTLRQQALGNSMCVPVMNWIGKRIDYVEKQKVR
jgi:DNA (cytosine-5)-methyltransferase 1